MTYADYLRKVQERLTHEHRYGEMTFICAASDYVASGSPEAYVHRKALAAQVEQILALASERMGREVAVLTSYWAHMRLRGLGANYRLLDQETRRLRAYHARMSWLDDLIKQVES